jgi:putative ABC transport system permease protein
MNMMSAVIDANIDAQVEELSGGYEIFGYSSELPPEYIHSFIDAPDSNLSEEMFNDIVPSVGGPVAYGYPEGGSRGGGLNGSPSGDGLGQNGEWATLNILGFPGDFLRSGSFELEDWVSEYRDEDDVWEAVEEDPGVVLVDSSIVYGEGGGGPDGEAFSNVGLGETVMIVGEDNSTHEKRVIGVLKTTLFGGFITNELFVREELNYTTSPVVLFDVSGGEDPDEIGKDLERLFLAYGMQTFVLETIVKENLKAMNQFFNLFDAYMSLGLVVGLAGLGIITLRAVRERRQQIGMLRAIGFSKGMVRKAFLMEAMFISVVGITIGVVLGIILGWQMWYYEFRPDGLDVFSIPYMDLLVVAGIALTATALCTIPTAHQAAKVTPAEALRYE